MHSRNSRCAIRSSTAKYRSSSPVSSADQVAGNPRWKDLLYADLDVDLYQTEARPGFDRTFGCSWTKTGTVEAEVCGPVEIQLEGFEPIFSEVMFLDMKPKNDRYEPLIGYMALFVPHG